MDPNTRNTAFPLPQGTSTHDGVAIAHATLEHIITTIQCTCLFVTHYPILTSLGRAYKVPQVEDGGRSWGTVLPPVPQGDL